MPNQIVRFAKTFSPFEELLPGNLNVMVGSRSDEGEYRKSIKRPSLRWSMSIQAGTASRSENDSDVSGNRPERR